jgi:26S proteasome non-ATPase regulatory subunit 5
LFSSIENDIGLIPIAVETIGFVGESADGKRALEKLGDAMQSCCRRLGKFITNSQTDVRVKSLDATRQLIYLPVEHQTNELLALTEHWFSLLSDGAGTDVLRVILSVAKQPFAELRLVALGLIRSLALVLWGQRILHSHPGFNEYLLDRSTEGTKEGLEEKFSIVKTLVESPTVADVFGWEYVARLRTYERDGPFYVRRETQVAMDNAD